MHQLRFGVRVSFQEGLSAGWSCATVSGPSRQQSSWALASSLPFEFSIFRLRGSTACDGSPNKKHNDSPHRCTNEACSFACVIPAKSLTQISGDESTNDAQERS